MFLTEVTSIDQTSKFVANKLLKELNLDKLCKVFSNDNDFETIVHPRLVLLERKKHLSPKTNIYL